jgi:hypothetical protein
VVIKLKDDVQVESEKEQRGECQHILVADFIATPRKPARIVSFP